MREGFILITAEPGLAVELTRTRNRLSDIGLLHPPRHTGGMGFRVLIAGPGVRPSCSYASLCAARTRCSPTACPTWDCSPLAVAAHACLRAVSHATERILKLTPLVPDFRHFPTDAPERRDGYLVPQADAAVIVWRDCEPAVR